MGCDLTSDHTVAARHFEDAKPVNSAGLQQAATTKFTSLKRLMSSKTKAITPDFYTIHAPAVNLITLRFYGSLKASVLSGQLCLANEKCEIPATRLPSTHPPQRRRAALQHATTRGNHEKKEKRECLLGQCISRVTQIREKTIHTPRFLRDRDENSRNRRGVRGRPGI